LGADTIINPEEDNVSDRLKEWTGGRGVEAAFECTGSEIASRSALENITQRGALVLVGVGRSLTINPWEDMIKRECTLIGTRSFRTEDFTRMSKLVTCGLPIEKIITHRYRLEDAKEAFSVFSSGDCGKVIFVGK
jgi:propanol-preferring alcohol dehydrogenase